MSNPSGVNQFQGFSIDPPYGAGQQQAALTRTAPMSGAPVAGHSLNTPRRNQRRAVRGAPQPAPAAPLVPQAAVQPTPHMLQASWWQQVAALDGASPLVKRLAQQAQLES